MVRAASACTIVETTYLSLISPKEGDRFRFRINRSRSLRENITPVNGPFEVFLVEVV